jgi:hypothetical protein
MEYIFDSPTARYVFAADKRYKFILGIIWSLIFTCIVVFVFLQTDFFVRFFLRPNNLAGIKPIMAADREAQSQRRAQYLATADAKQIAPGIVLHHLLTDHEKAQVTQARAFLLDNSELQTKLDEVFGVSFKNLDAVVIPGAEMSFENCVQLGITHAGWNKYKRNAAWGFDVDGLTVRDRAQDAQETLDGRPRIAVPAWGFKPPVKLRRVLFHEMLHALNVPGYKPWQSISVTQSDLAYLPEYSVLLKHAGLDEEGTGTWGILIVFLIILARCIQLTYKQRPGSETTA